MSFCNEHVIPRAPQEALKEKQEAREHRPLKGILKKTPWSSLEDSKNYAKSSLKGSASSLVEVLGASGMREMIPLAEIDPAVCVVGDPIVADRPSTDVSERPARLLDGASEAGKHALFTEKSTREVLVKEGPLKFSIGGCIARTKIEGFGDTDERFISDTSDISMEDTRPTTPQKQTASNEGGTERNLIEEAKSLLEFYLDDKTALRDELLVKQIRRWSGWISLNFMATYGRLRTVTRSHTAVTILRQAVKASKVLELSDDETKVRRLIPFPHYDETFASRAVVQLHQEMPKSQSQIFDVFKMFGQVYAIYVLPRMLCVPCALPDAPEIVLTNVRKFLSRNPALLEVEWKALAFVEFSSHREAETALFVLTRMAFRSSGCGGPELPVLLPVKPHPQMHLKLHDPQEVKELTRVLRLALQADEDRKQNPEMAHEESEKLCARRTAGKSFRETMARDPAIVDCGLPVVGPRAHRESASAFELRSVQVARQRVAWEPCIACQLQERGMYDPIAHAFTLRYSTVGKNSKHVKKTKVTVKDTVKDEAVVVGSTAASGNKLKVVNGIDDEKRRVGSAVTKQTDPFIAANDNVDAVNKDTDADNDKMDTPEIIIAEEQGTNKTLTNQATRLLDKCEERESSPLSSSMVKSCPSSATQSPTSGYCTDECSSMSCDDHPDEVSSTCVAGPGSSSSTPLKAKALDSIEE
ncbi:uncharacterized protein LOC111254867 isoform X3 [Varroa destructor]|uniref:HTH La-type RNA-binding domain-containing protein n=1 Tax=Varroa destructor TaxID=109461 RepID=A0A7M7KTV1_VARDE|nr:uncharacterized protein LOC111254867 isoform X3 [Varroa destructor]